MLYDSSIQLYPKAVLGLSLFGNLQIFLTLGKCNILVLRTVKQIAATVTSNTKMNIRY